MPATLHDILQVPGNRAAFDKLAALLQSGEAIAFTGAGTSVPPYPLWPALIRRFRSLTSFGKHAVSMRGGTGSPIAKLALERREPSEYDVNLQKF